MSGVTQTTLRVNGAGTLASPNRKVTKAVVLGPRYQAVVGWGAIQAARAEKARLQAEVAEMQASRDEWARAGFLSKLERCGPRARLCVRVDESAGAFQASGHADYRVVQGY